MWEQLEAGGAEGQPVPRNRMMGGSKGLKTVGGESHR